MAVSAKWAVADFSWSYSGVWEELDVTDAQDLGASVIDVRFSPSNGYKVSAYMWGGLRLFAEEEGTP